ncbi:MAG: hypothetical protein E8D43_00050 [Nitrospira sp.]|nr:MAG: hypothetical protein E8D43_00050 [Nitrospira sp.]
MKWYAKPDLAVDVYRYTFKFNKVPPALMGKVSHQPGVPTLGPPKFQYFNPKGFEAYGQVVSKEWVARLPPANAKGRPTGRGLMPERGKGADDPFPLLQNQDLPPAIASKVGEIAPPKVTLGEGASVKPAQREVPPTTETMSIETPKANAQLPAASSSAKPQSDVPKGPAPAVTSQSTSPQTKLAEPTAEAISATDAGLVPPKMTGQQPPRRIAVPSAKPALPSPTKAKPPKTKTATAEHAPKNRLSGMAQEKQVKRVYTKQRSPNSPDYHYFEEGNFKDFVQSMEDHATQMRPGSSVTLNKEVLTESRLAFIQRTKLNDSAWMKKYNQLQKDLQAVNETLSGIRGDKKAVEGLWRRKSSIERLVEEWNHWLMGEVGTTKPDMIERFFSDKWPDQVVDITQRPFDPPHNFKTEFYVEVVKELTGKSNVIGRDIDTVVRQKIFE